MHLSILLALVMNVSNAARAPIGYNGNLDGPQAVDVSKDDNKVVSKIAKLSGGFSSCFVIDVAIAGTDVNRILKPVFLLSRYRIIRYDHSRNRYQ